VKRKLPLVLGIPAGAVGTVACGRATISNHYFNMSRENNQSNNYACLLSQKDKKGTIVVNVFRECRERVTAEDAARRYGLTFDRKGWAVCPFHNDRHPSMSFRNGRFRCWACGATGDSVEFTKRLLRLDTMAAVERLNIDFGLALSLHRKPTQKEAEAARRHLELVKRYKQFETWREKFISKLCIAYRVAHIALREVKSWEQLTEQEIIAIRLQAQIEYWIDVLDCGTPEDQAQIFREQEQINRWMKRILND